MQLDHLVVAARSLADGVAWCEATLGIVPGPGGEHAFMGTHNRLFGIGSAAFPRAYFEIIAIDPAAPRPARPRWFDLDSPALQRALAGGPQLIHWVARCDDVRSTVTELRAAGIHRGEVLQAERATPRGLLRWQITLRDDGRRLFGGALPTLIEWGDVHPADTMPPSGVTLAQVGVAGLRDAAAALLPEGVRTSASGPPLSVTLSTPLGNVVLKAPDPEANDVQH
jgi:Glyoxalase-like domain